MEAEQYADEYTVHLLLGEGGQAKYLIPHSASTLAAKITLFMLSKSTFPALARNRLSKSKWNSSQNSTFLTSSTWLIIAAKLKSRLVPDLKKSAHWSF